MSFLLKIDALLNKFENEPAFVDSGALQYAMETLIEEFRLPSEEVSFDGFLRLARQARKKAVKNRCDAYGLLHLYEILSGVDGARGYSIPKMEVD